MVKHNELRRPIIFIGTGRSGTTVISEILMRHPDLAYPSNYQNKFPTQPAINMARCLFDNRLWKIWGQKKQLNETPKFNRIFFKPDESYAMWDYLTGKDVDFSRSFLLNQTASDLRTNFIRTYFYRMIRFQGRKRLAFKVTGPSRIGYLSSIFPDAVFLNLKRNIVPTISSFLKVNYWTTKGMSKLWWTDAYTEEEKSWATEHSNRPELLTAFQLKKIQDVTASEVGKYRPRYAELHYEDFVDDPPAEIAKALQYLQLEENASDCYTYLANTQIINRNRKDTDYFLPEQLKGIYQISRT